MTRRIVFSIVAAALLAAALTTTRDANRSASSPTGSSAAGASSGVVPDDRRPQAKVARPAPAPARAASDGDSDDAAHSAEPSRPFVYSMATQLPDGSFPLQWEAAAAQALRPGDVFSIALPMGRVPYVATVTVEASVPGGRRLTGRLHDGGVDSWPFSLTLMADANIVVGSFATDGRRFEIDARDGSGRLRDATSDGDRLIGSERAMLHEHKQ